MVISYFLRREERSKEASTPSKASPYMGRMQLIPRAGSLHQSFGMALEPLPSAYASGSPCFSHADYANRLSSRSSSKTFFDKRSDKVVTCVPSVASEQSSSAWTSQASIAGALRQAKRAKLVTARCGSFFTTFENIPHEEVFRGCTIIGIFFDSCIA